MANHFLFYRLESEYCVVYAFSFLVIVRNSDGGDDGANDSANEEADFNQNRSFCFSMILFAGRKLVYDFVCFGALFIDRKEGNSM